jgi:hypothetical protein
VLLVLPAPGLAVGTVPIEQDAQRDDKEAVRDRDRRHHRGRRLGKVVYLQHHPGVEAAVVAGERGTLIGNVLK